MKCRKCQKEIGVKDNYCCLKEWKKGDFLSEGYFHTHCYREGVHGTKEEREITKKANSFMDWVNSFTKKLGKKEEVIVI